MHKFNWWWKNRY